MPFPTCAVSNVTRPALGARFDRNARVLSLKRKACVIQLKYGRGVIELDPVLLPAEPIIFSGGDPERVPDEAAAVRKALENPAALDPLSRFVERGDRVLIVVSDITRAAATDVMLPPILDVLGEAGCVATVMVGLGMHRPSTDEEKRRIVGEGACDRVRILDHDARAPAENLDVGFTSRNNEIRMDKTALQADKLIVTGTIGYHILAGFGGGRKGVMPGIAGRRCILYNHMLPLTTQAVGWNPASRPGNLAGNPVHEDMTEAALMLDAMSPIFLVNTVLNSKQELAGVFAGDIVKAFEQGCEFFDRHYCLRAEKQVDLLIVSCGGYPKDINFIQSHKSMEYAFPELREGGVMIVLAECCDGLGNEAFLDWFQHETEIEFELSLKKDYLQTDNMNAQTSYLVFRKAQRAAIFLLSTLPDAAVERMGMRPVKSLGAALRSAKDLLGADFTAAVVPAGGYYRIERQGSAGR